MRQESILGYGDKTFLCSFEDVEAEDYFKIPVTLYQLKWRYLLDVWMFIKAVVKPKLSEGGEFVLAVNDICVSIIYPATL